MHQSSFSIITHFKELVVKHYPKGIIKVLDVGSYGVNGTFKEIFSDSTRFNYVGLDVTAGPNVDYVPKDPYRWLELADDSFDILISGQAFEHIEFPWLIIEEMHRTLKPNGLICIIAPSRGPEHKYPVDCWRYYPDGFRALAKWVGLEVLEAKTFWGSTGFTDGSDQWGDTLCILHKPAADRPLQREHKNRPKAQLLNSNNPLRSGKKESYYGFARNEVIETLRKSAITPGRVLEIGCAGGATGKHLKEKLQVSQYVGVELSPEAAEVARQYLDKVIVADIESVDLNAAHGLQYGEFDLLIALDVLEHLYDPWDVLAELTRYVKDGGHIVASIPNIQNITVIRDLIKGKWEYVDAGLLDATHVRFFTIAETRKMFAGAGLAIERTDCVLNPPIDLATIMDSENSIVDERTSIRGLTRDELLHLHTYQYIVVAQKVPVGIMSSVKPAGQQKPSNHTRPVPASSVLAREKATPELISIVILTYNQKKYTKECIESIRKHTPEAHEIIFVDNGSTDGTVKWLKTLLNEHNEYRLIENGENLGFAKGCNQGIEASRGEYILLLNNDVVVTAHWLSDMLACLNSVPDSGIVGPMTNSISGPQKVGQVGYTSLDQLDAYARRFREKNRYQRTPLRRIVGFCMLFRRALAEQIGFLDESFGSGNFEDDDYCLRAALVGRQNLIAGDVFIHHYGSRSFIGNKIDYDSSLSGNRKIFTDKWSGIDGTSLLGKRLLAITAQEQAREFNDKGQIDKALETLLLGIQNVPEEKTCYYAMAEMLLGNRQFKDALEILSALPQDDKDQKLALLTGYAKEGLGLPHEAEHYAERALAVNAASAAGLNLKGILANQKGDLETAQDFFTKAIDADPGYGEPYTNLGFLTWAGGRHDEAFNLFERGVILSPAEAGVVAAYHSAATEMKKYAQAEEVFRAIRALRPLDRRILFLLIDILIKQENFGLAMQEIEQSMILFGVDDGILSAALDVRNRVGPHGSGPAAKKNGSLSVCMIVKNEELHIAKCLMSVKPVVDEMIVVDTGSTDRTKDIARAFGAKVYDVPWTGDFSEARNLSLAKAAGDWILILDADEVIAERDHAALRRLMTREAKNKSAFSLATRNYIVPVYTTGWTANDGSYGHDEAGTGWFPSYKVRLFPRDSRIRFVNPVHELVEPSLISSKIPVKGCDIPVHHYGKLDAEKDIAKGEVYYLLGKKKLEETGETVNALRELAIQAGGLKRYEEAIELWRKALNLQPDLTLAHLNMGSIYLEIDRYDDALAATKKAYELAPEMKEAAYNYALCELYAGNVGRSISVLEDLAATSPDYPSAKVLLAMAHCCGGTQERRLELFRQLQKMHFGFAESILKLSRKLVSAGQATYAASLLDAAIATNNVNADILHLREVCHR
ncbi:MAG: glycosyltransferase [Nitrospirae bacterium]|nr:glycosyltransferase [Nitrospirota bacterium]NTW66489.1 glycosyltransferase [Nitrospirota bacterium]